MFGAENGHIYSRPIGDTFGTAAGGDLNLNTVDTAITPGAVRSSICYDGSNLYLTTKNGYLWKVNPDLSGTPLYVELKVTPSGQPDGNVQNASSTPVVSPSGYVYVGGYNINWDDGFGAYKGALKAVYTRTWNTSGITATTLWSASSNGAIQSSPVVFYDEDNEVDYVYFTTNGAAGQARCVAFNIGN